MSGPQTGAVAIAVNLFPGQPVHHVMTTFSEREPLSAIIAETLSARSSRGVGIGLFNHDALFLAGGLVLSASVIAVAFANKFVTLVEQFPTRVR